MTVSAQPAHEIWAAIPKFSAYQASSLGRIRSLKHVDAVTGQPYILSPAPCGGTGYVTVYIKRDGDETSSSQHVSHLCAAAFIGPKPSPKHCVLHANDVRTDNRAENIRWGTRAENISDAVRNGGRLNGTTPRSWGAHGSLTVAQVRSIRRQAEAGARIVDIADSMELDYDVVWKAARGVSYAWVTDSAATTNGNRIAAQAARDAHKADYSAQRDRATIEALLASAPPVGQVQRRAPHSQAKAPASKGWN